MGLFQRFFGCQTVASAIFLLGFLVLPVSRVAAQSKQSETAESLGLGTASRFETGYTPIVIDRTTIVPGVPFNVKPTMDNLVKTSGPSMGGILNRFDTSKFGQFFNSSSIPVGITVTPPPKKPVPAGTAAQVAPSATLYPAQIDLGYDGQVMEQTDVTSPQVKKTINQHLSEVLQRFPLTDPDEQVVLVFEGRKLILRGQVGSSYAADLLFITMQMEPGVEEVVNEIRVVETANR